MQQYGVLPGCPLSNICLRAYSPANQSGLPQILHNENSADRKYIFSKLFTLPYSCMQMLWKIVLVTFKDSHKDFQPPDMDISSFVTCLSCDIIIPICTILQ